MSNNCLVTKLKGTVDNPDLTKLGELVININLEYDTIVQFLYSPMYSIDSPMKTSIEGGVFTDSAGSTSYTEITGNISTSVYIRCTSHENKIRIKILPKYDIQVIDIRSIPVNINDFYGLGGIESNLKRLVLYHPQTYGDICVFNNLKSRDNESECFFSFSSPNIVGDFEKLNFIYSGSKDNNVHGYYMGGTNITGTIEGFLKNNLDIFPYNPENIKYMHFYDAPGKITLNGNRMTAGWLCLHNINNNIYTFRLFSNADPETLTNEMIYNRLTDSWTYNS